MCWWKPWCCCYGQFLSREACRKDATVCFRDANAKERAELLCSFHDPRGAPLCTRWWVLYGMYFIARQKVRNKFSGRRTGAEAQFHRLCYCSAHGASLISVPLSRHASIAANPSSGWRIDPTAHHLSNRAQVGIRKCILRPKSKRALGGPNRFGAGF